MRTIVAGSLAFKERMKLEEPLGRDGVENLPCQPFAEFSKTEWNWNIPEMRRADNPS